MLSLIEEIVNRFGGRVAGSLQEVAAQHFLKKRWQIFCKTVAVEEFTAPLTAKSIALKVFCGVFYLNLILYWIALPYAAALAAINMVLFVGYFIANQTWLDTFFPQKESLNVVGTLEPQGMVKQTILLSGHIDSVYEFKWWYKLKQSGMILTIISCLLIIEQAIFYLLLVLLPEGSILWNWSNFFQMLLVLLTPATITLVDMHGKNVVDGAIDNLTGIAVTDAIGRYFAHDSGNSNLQHTRLQLISFGSEEVGLRGSKAYIQKHLEALQQQNALLINIDTIKDPEHLTIVKAEWSSLTFYPKRMIERLSHNFKKQQLHHQILPLGVGATDAASFNRKGIPAVSIIGLTSTELDPCYHTRLDNLQHLDPTAMEQLAEGLIEFIKEQDERGL